MGYYCGSKVFPAPRSTIEDCKTRVPAQFTRSYLLRVLGGTAIFLCLLLLVGLLSLAKQEITVRSSIIIPIVVLALLQNALLVLLLMQASEELRIIQGYGHAVISRLRAQRGDEAQECLCVLTGPFDSSAVEDLFAQACGCFCDVCDAGCWVKGVRDAALGLP